MAAPLEPRPNGSEAPFLDVRGLTREFPIRGPGGRRVLRAVDGVDLVIPHPGETVGIAGESGSGKSTLARLILRLIEPTAGQVWMEGTPVTALRGEALRRWRQRAQMVFQDPWWSLNPRQRLGDAVTEPLAAHVRLSRAERRRAAASLLEQVGLPASFASRYPHELSGGQRQRVGIARALSVRPRLVILDEPTSALDVSVQAQILQLLEDLRARHGLTYLFISHDLRVLEYLCDRLVVMYRGAVVEEGPVAEVFARPRHPYTQVLLAARRRGPLAGREPVPVGVPVGLDEAGPAGRPAEAAAVARATAPANAHPGVRAGSSAAALSTAPEAAPGTAPAAAMASTPAPVPPATDPGGMAADGAGDGAPGTRGCRFVHRCPFAQARCWQEAPGLRTVDGVAGHKAACHFAEIF